MTPDVRLHSMFTAENVGPSQASNIVMTRSLPPAIPFVVSDPRCAVMRGDVGI
jgi:hypothetical protein